MVLCFVAGWESQLLETGFLAACLCPLLSLRRVALNTRPPFVVIFAFRWLLFRIMLGAVRDVTSQQNYRFHFS